MGLAVTFAGNYGKHRTFQGRFEAFVKTGSLKIRLITEK
jgi:hypothetical protein